MARANSVVSLLVGLGIGFGFMYPWMKQKAPDIVRATPLPFVPGPAAAEPSAPPPLDRERVTQLQQAARENPKNYDAELELANIYFDQRDFDQAANWYKQALAVKPGEVDVRTDLGTALYNLGRVDESIAQFRKTLETDPNHPQALFNLGLALLDGKKNPQGAILSWERLLETHPDFPARATLKQKIDSLKGKQ
jgi:Tfp pilus assembly protein PilF